MLVSRRHGRAFAMRNESLGQEVNSPSGERVRTLECAQFKRDRWGGDTESGWDGVRNWGERRIYRE